MAVCPVELGLRDTCDLYQLFAAHAHASWRLERRTVSNGGVVTVIDGFLPPEIAEHWYSALNVSWHRTAPCRERGACDSGADCSWLYATNSQGGNAKVRSVFRVAERRQEVEDIYLSRRFAYSKWELAARSPLYQAVGNMMATAEVREAVARAVGLAAAGGTPALGSVSDYFITAYDQGDFLSTHSDGASGSLAWVLHLAKGAWDGGALRFNAGRAAPTQDFSPAFNRMLLFLTRPDHTRRQEDRKRGERTSTRGGERQGRCLVPSARVCGVFSIATTTGSWCVMEIWLLGTGGGGVACDGKLQMGLSVQKIAGKCGSFGIPTPATGDTRVADVGTFL